jgi:Excalibur calcium-binding domain
MNHKRPLILAAAALAATLATGLAQARDADVRWSVTIGSPAVVPVYAPAPHVYSRPVYQAAPVYVPVHAPVRVAYREPTRWDRDGDGIPNRHDRLYNPRWDLDGDGIPNRHDRHFDNRHDRYDRYDRDGDGIPNRYDPRPNQPGRGYGR